MAPRKKAEETKSTSSEKPATRRSARMTRSTAKRFNAKLTELPTESGKKRKQEKAAESKKKKVKTQVKEEAETKTSSSSEAEVEGKAEEVKEEEPEADEDGTKEEDAKEESPAGDAVTKTIVIEHCKQCNAFKTRAIQVKDGLLSAFPGISVLLNPEKCYQCGVEMIRRDLLTGHWKPYLERAISLKPCYEGGINGGEVAALILQEIAFGKNHASDKFSGARRLRDANVLGYQLQRVPGRDALMILRFYMEIFKVFQIQ